MKQMGKTVPAVVLDPANVDVIFPSDWEGVGVGVTVAVGGSWDTTGDSGHAEHWQSLTITGDVAQGSGVRAVGWLDFGTISGFNYPVTKVSPISDSTWKELESISDESLKNKSSELLSYISLDANQYAIESMIQQESDVLLDVRSVNEVVIEWIFKNVRIGFTVNTDPFESGWFMASNGNLGNITGEGHLPDTNIHFLVSWLSYFARISNGS